VPIDTGRIGYPKILGCPAMRRASSLQAATGPTGGGPMGSGILRAGFRAQPFRSPTLSTSLRFISGVTRDSTGAPLAGCQVDLYLYGGTGQDTQVDSVVSDGSGNFSFGATAGPYYIVAYKAGAPDVAGTTVNTLAGT
jgi:hypothetical protein